MGKSSKVIGRWGHMDLFWSDLKSHFGRFRPEMFLDFQNFFACELALVYTILNDIRLTFHPLNLVSQRAYCIGS